MVEVHINWSRWTQAYAAAIDMESDFIVFDCVGEEHHFVVASPLVSFFYTYLDTVDSFTIPS